MPNSQDILWFKQQFRSEIEAAVQGTPFTLDMLTAVACQETGGIWSILRKKDLSIERILELCVGDTIDGKPGGGGRRAFPRNKAELVAQPGGVEMFGIARQALVDMAQFIPGFKGPVANPAKFCHGYGIFQFDLQFFKTEPDYFLQKRYALFPDCLAKAISELRSAQSRANLQGKTKLTDLEMAAVAIAYNTGRFVPSKGLKQGFKDSAGKFYGENFFEFLRLAHTVVVPDVAPAETVAAQPIADVIPTEPAAGTTVASSGPALVAQPTAVEADGKVFEVDVKKDPLNLRAEPNTTAAVTAKLPDGQLVQAVSNKKVNGFLEVETSLHGANFRGFAFAQFLKPAQGVEAVPVSAPAVAATGPLPAVIMPRKPGTLTRRVDPATAHSLNEPGQPAGRKGTTPDELRAELNAIVEWLAVDKTANKRYQSSGGSTFCNIYAHDYCHLAGIYLPRVWWSQGAVEKLAQGQNVQPLLGNTIDEERANGLFRWLRDFGMRFGWQRTGNLAKLQQDVNLGAVGVIVARRTDDGRSGHITIVVPESNDLTARRNTQGEVIAPVQSQAGVRNFRRGNGTAQWWLGDQFAESAFWVHA
ncbi:MAG: hypothetical protein QOH49_1205 [Acidobacteriota bacterium]|jgi:hypothetical protein|nr:hypothetical protein [Acidobacteriota bacterium]